MVHTKSIIIMYWMWFTMALCKYFHWMHSQYYGKRLLENTGDFVKCVERLLTDCCKYISFLMRFFGTSPKQSLCWLENCHSLWIVTKNGLNIQQIHDRQRLPKISIKEKNIIKMFQNCSSSIFICHNTSRILWSCLTSSVLLKQLYLICPLIWDSAQYVYALVCAVVHQHHCLCLSIDPSFNVSVVNSMQIINIFISNEY